MALHYYWNESTEEWEIRDNISGELLANFECSDDSIEWVKETIDDLEKERDEQIRQYNTILSALQVIHEIANEDLRTANNSSGTWSIEAIAAKALGLPTDQRDLGFTADEKSDD